MTPQESVSLRGERSGQVAVCFWSFSSQTLTRLLQATCLSCEKGAWHFVWPDFGVFEPDFDETEKVLGWRREF